LAADRECFAIQAERSRGQKVILDRDLAELYGVPTKVFNQAVKRNVERFPERFMFQVNEQEKDELVTNCDRFKTFFKYALCIY